MQLGNIMFEPLVLLPDMMCDARLFQSIISEFSATRTIIVPNFGSEPTIELMAQSVLQALPERFSLIGAGLGGLLRWISFGGMRNVCLISH